MEPTQNEGTPHTETTTGTTPTTTAVDGTGSEAHSPTLMGMLAYIGPLVLIPYFLAKDNSFVRFHVQQGLVLFVIEIILWVLDGFMFYSHFLWNILTLINFGLLILSVIGIVNVLQKKEKELPLVGNYAKNFKV